MTNYKEYKEGDFSFIEESNWRETLSSMYMAISQLNLWSFLNEEPPLNTGYMFWKHDAIDQIMNHPLVDQCGHSSASFGVSMRIMKYIKTYGWTAYINHYTKKNIYDKEKKNINDIKNTIIEI